MDKIAAIKTANMNFPTEGAKALPFYLELASAATFTRDFFAEFAGGDMDIAQSIWIDNTANTAELTVTVFGGVIPQIIRVRPYAQGVWPLFAPVGNPRIRGATNGAVNVPCMLLNTAQPYWIDAPIDGITVVPTLTNDPVEVALAAGSNQLVAAVPGQVIRVYRALLSIDGGDTIKFQSNATDLTGPLVLTGGGSVTLLPSGVPWFSTAVGEALNVDALAGGVTLGGIIGYTQSAP